jgi:hypothetical protein
MTQELEKLFKDHLAFCQGIMDDYVVDDGFGTEINVAIDNLKDEIANLTGAGDDKAYIKNDFKSIMDALQEMEHEEIEESKLLDLVAEIDDTLIYDYVKSEGYLYIKINNIVDQQKLEDFIKTEIYPAYNQQIEFML